jgi:hypothetical protein
LPATPEQTKRIVKARTDPFSGAVNQSAGGSCLSQIEARLNELVPLIAAVRRDEARLATKLDGARVVQSRIINLCRRALRDYQRDLRAQEGSLSAIQADVGERGGSSPATHRTAVEAEVDRMRQRITRELVIRAQKSKSEEAKRLAGEAVESMRGISRELDRAALKRTVSIPSAELPDDATVAELSRRIGIAGDAGSQLALKLLRDAIRLEDEASYRLVRAAHIDHAIAISNGGTIRAMEGHKQRRTGVATDEYRACKLFVATVQARDAELHPGDALDLARSCQLLLENTFAFVCGTPWVDPEIVSRGSFTARFLDGSPAKIDPLEPYPDDGTGAAYLARWMTRRESTVRLRDVQGLIPTAPMRLEGK